MLSAWLLLLGLWEPAFGKNAVAFGREEGEITFLSNAAWANDNCDENCYKENHPEVKALNLDSAALKLHYHQNGKKQGHNCACTPQAVPSKNIVVTKKSACDSKQMPAAKRDRFVRHWQKATPDPKGVFILAAHVHTRHQGHLLMLTLFGIWKHHPESSVVVVDNGSPVPLQKAIPKAFFDKHKKLVVVREEISRYEFGAYTSGLKYLHKSTGSWAIAKFERFYYMQAQIYLNEPVPRTIPGGCDMMPMMSGPGPPGDAKGKKLVTDYLDSHGLIGKLGKLGSKGDAGTSHTSFVSDLKGAKLLFESKALDGNFTHKVTAIYCEGMLGVIINRLMRKTKNLDHCGYANLPWTHKGPFWTKLHGSGKGGFTKSDTMALAELLRFADTDMDGRTDVGEFSKAIVSHPARFEQAWQSMCMDLPLINLPWVRDAIYSSKPLKVPPKDALQKLIEGASAGQVDLSGGFKGQCDPVSALFWAREATSGLNLDGYWDTERVERFFLPYKSIMYHRIAPGEHLWGGWAADKPWGGRKPDPDPAHRAARERFAKELPAALLRLAAPLVIDHKYLDFQGLVEVMKKGTENVDTPSFMTTVLPFW